MQSTQSQFSSNRSGAFEINVDANKNAAANIKVKGPKHPSILKNYKSCPVSPVHEEIDWSTIDENRSGNQSPYMNTNYNNQSFGSRGARDRMPNKRHSMYSDDAKLILDTIHADTEKMIAEITQKYGDLNIDGTLPGSSACNMATEQPNNETKDNLGDNCQFQSDEDGNFSSDSLEDCSLDFDYSGKCQTNPRVKKTVCRKKHRKNESRSTMPTRSVSEYFIYDEFYLNSNRNVSLSDILNEDADKQKPDYAFLNSQRHSSASFFLAPERKSQESLISDDISGCGVSYCNSMESILSDESECKSAPLEALFSRTKREMCRYSGNMANDYSNRFEAQNTTSKSYGSSPNNGYSGGFDYYMDQRYSYGFYDRDACNIANYDYDCLMSNATSAKNSNRCSPLPPPPPEFQNITKSSAIPISYTLPALSMMTNCKNDDFIPRFGSKNDQYSTQPNKSLSKEFANQRQVNNSNPLYTCNNDDSDYFQRKPVKPAIPAKPSKLVLDSIKAAPSTSNTNTSPSVQESLPSALKKSCSFEIEMFHNRGRMLQQKSAAKKYEQNLQKFEKDRYRRNSTQSGGTLEMPHTFVAHKPPVANRRSASMKTRRSSRTKDRPSTAIDQIVPVTYNNRYDQKSTSKKEKESVETKEAEERSFEIYIAEKGVCEDDNMDSLELYAKPNLYKDNSVDSLDEIAPNKRQRSKPIDIQPIATMNLDFGESSSTLPSDFLSHADYSKFRDIEKKIDVVNKLVELEGKKLEQERFNKELRMRPFVCVREKGYVKSLTVNFDNLAKSVQYERELARQLSERSAVRRNHSLPDVLEVAKYRFDDDFLHRKQRSTDNYLDGYGIEGVGLGC